MKSTPPRPPRRRRRAHALLAALLLALAPAPAVAAPAATGDLNVGLAKMAAQIRDHLKEKKQEKIAVNSFRGTARLASGAGTSIVKILSDELTRLGVAIDRDADLEVHGEFRVGTRETASKQRAVTISAQIVDQQSGQTVAELESCPVLSMKEIAILTGATVSLPLNTEAIAEDPKGKQKLEEERVATFNEALAHPSPHLNKTELSAGEGSPYAIEVLVLSNGFYHPRAASRDTGGLAFLKIRRGESYAVKLINNSKSDAAVTLTIDGLSVFAFSENPSYDHYIVPAQSHLQVRGYHRNNRESRRFVVGGFREAEAAGRLAAGDPSGIGLLTATFSAAWDPKGPPPADEPPDPGKSPGGPPSGDQPDGTRQGPTFQSNLVEVTRHVGRIRSSISVRYNREGEPADLPGAPRP